MSDVEVFWESEDGQVQLIRLPCSLYIIRYRGCESAPMAFDVAQHYLWEEFV